MMFNNISALSFDWHGRIHVVVSSWQCLPSWCWHVKATGSGAMRVERFLEVFERDINYEILGWRLGLNSYSGEKSSQSKINISVSQDMFFCSSLHVYACQPQTRQRLSLGMLGKAIELQGLVWNVFVSLQTDAFYASQSKCRAATWYLPLNCV